MSPRKVTESSMISLFQEASVSNKDSVSASDIITINYSTTKKPQFIEQQQDKSIHDKSNSTTTSTAPSSSKVRNKSTTTSTAPSSKVRNKSTTTSSTSTAPSSKVRNKSTTSSSTSTAPSSSKVRNKSTTTSTASSSSKVRNKSTTTSTAPSSKVRNKSTTTSTAPSSKVRNKSTTTSTAPSSKVRNKSTTTSTAPSSKVRNKSTTTSTAPSSKVRNKSTTTSTAPSSKVRNKSTTTSTAPSSKVRNKSTTTSTAPSSKVRNKSTTTSTAPSSKVRNKSTTTSTAPSSKVRNKSTTTSTAPSSKVRNKSTTTSTAPSSKVRNKSTTTSTAPSSKVRNKSTTTSTAPSSKVRNKSTTTSTAPSSKVRNKSTTTSTAPSSKVRNKSTTTSTAPSSKVRNKSTTTSTAPSSKVRNKSTSTSTAPSSKVRNKSTTTSTAPSSKVRNKSTTTSTASSSSKVRNKSTTTSTAPSSKVRNKSTTTSTAPSSKVRNKSTTTSTASSSSKVRNKSTTTSSTSTAPSSSKVRNKSTSTSTAPSSKVRNKSTSTSTAPSSKVRNKSTTTSTAPSSKVRNKSTSTSTAPSSKVRNKSTSTSSTSTASSSSKVRNKSTSTSTAPSSKVRNKSTTTSSTTNDHTNNSKTFTNFFIKIHHLYNFNETWRLILAELAKTNPKLKKVLSFIKNIDSKTATTNEEQEVDEDKAIQQKLAFELERKSLFKYDDTPIFINGEMKDYQIDGLNWMVSLDDNNISGILGDEMGLGKTLQTIAFMGHLKYNGNNDGPHLVIAPTSVVNSWQLEFNKWLQDFKIIVLTGNKEERAKIMEKILKYEFDVLIVSYEIFLRDVNFLTSIQFTYTILDEAHRLKNEKSITRNQINLLQSKSKILISGTPLQNNIEELWSLVRFIIPDIFDEKEDLNKWINNQVTNSDPLQKSIELLKPILLRRSKQKVSTPLPTKKEIIIFTKLTSLQKNLYEAILKKDYETINSNNHNTLKTRLTNISMQLRKCCNHPYLFDGAEPGPPYTTDEHLINNCGKMILLDKMLKKFKNEGSRVLMFSQMSRVLDILEDYCNFREYEYCRIDGSTSYEDRIEAIDDYNDPNSSKFLFLLTTRAGGLGINLTSADIVVLYDSDWNPQADLQAMDRAHRIGQTKQVKVFRLITENSVETELLKSATRKAQLNKFVYKNGDGEKEDIDLNNSGIINVAKDHKVQEDDIEEILRAAEIQTSNYQSKTSNITFAEAQIPTKTDVYIWKGQNFKERKRKIEDDVEILTYKRPRR
ncbi:hypothetical protein KGF54_002934 [Candida jiufengensis]|uniref:uncharacterized protein n=1 Tax=Candida jiufengensis TaxID=497108 RepID=UPI002225B48A|nr:uncharacterized protein KGF54_002934 [Candida jiufengensis]KAI5953562.1 hypothetical protein KGF54_002934 [Candida jiufengensis]